MALMKPGRGSGRRPALALLGRGRGRRARTVYSPDKPDARWEFSQKTLQGVGGGADRVLVMCHISQHSDAAVGFDCDGQAQLCAKSVSLHKSFNHPTRKLTARITPARELIPAG